MPDSNLSHQMRADWNERAREDAYYYVAFGGRGQDDEAFFATAADVIRSLEAELKRLPPASPRSRRGLEIGCGPGRLMRPMSWNFGEIHGVDVSDEMIRLAVAKLRGVPNAYPRQTSGTDLSHYSNDYFDFVYSYAVFQHIPSREVVFQYLSEARRVLKIGGILRCQINGLPRTAKQYTTWEGVRIGAAEIADFACANDFQLLALEGADTQYMWVTLRKQPAGWFAALDQNGSRVRARIRRVVNSHSGEPVAPARGRFAAITLWMENLPQDCDLNQINIAVDGKEAAPVYIGPPVFDGLCQVNALLPPELRTGLVPVELFWFGERLADEGWVRIIPPGPPVPRIRGLSDGINLSSGPSIRNRTVKLSLEELSDPSLFSATVDGIAAPDLDIFCTDPLNECFEINLTLPPKIRAGSHRVEFRVGKRVFPAVQIEVSS